MTTASQDQHPQATPDDLHDAAFRAAVHAWLTEHSTDAFREQRNMPLQENVAVRCLGQPRAVRRAPGPPYTTLRKHRAHHEAAVEAGHARAPAASRKRTNDGVVATVCTERA